mmetsp:Transcript_14223/g.36356  ORF Transcript_14223/g.36356 Transcript_14223/m.36356 type:complete len:184 (-) Transcript_14223:90-641(-)
MEGVPKFLDEITEKNEGITKKMLRDKLVEKFGKEFFEKHLSEFKKEIVACEQRAEKRKRESSEEGGDDDDSESSEDEAPASKRTKAGGKAAAGAKAAPAKKAAAPPKRGRRTECTVSRKDFLAHAPEAVVTAFGETLRAKPREFSSGSFGYYINAKVPLQVGDETVQLQLGFNMTVVGSKNLQ